MEEQLEIAENRCNNLKDQLDQMKKLYQNKNDITKNLKIRTRKTIYSTRSSSPPKQIVESTSKLEFENKSDEEKCSDEQIKNQSERSSPNQSQDKLQEEYDQEKDTIVVLPVRQNSHAISTDNTGAAVQTINNILTGITNSVNRLSELHVHLEKDGSRSRPTSSRRRLLRDSACGDDEPLLNMDNMKFNPRTRTRSENPRNLTNLAEECLQDNLGEEVRFRSSSALSIKSKSGPKKKSKKKSVSNKQQNSTITVNITNKKPVKSSAKHTEKKFKIESVKMLGQDSNSILSPKKSKKQIKKLKANYKIYTDKRQSKISQSTDTDKLVELYHNTAAKGSETDSSNAEDHKYKQKEEKQKKMNSETVPHLQVEGLSEICEYKTADQGNYRETRMLSPIDEHGYIEPIAPRTECFSTCSKSYELPTIASKMKQVAKSYMKQFNIHSIPFCAAKSTSPSHNIGINIQQVMSIIKTRQPISGISPTLAHNIGLAAEKLNGRPFSTLVSSLGSRIGYGRLQCPLIRNTLNYQQLQEMAKEIPEEPCDGIEEDTKAVQHDSMNGASGDTNRMTHQSTVWTIDPANNRNCTCMPQNGIGFQQVLSKYQANTISTSTVAQMQNKMFRSRLPRYPIVSRRIRQSSRQGRSLENKSSGVLKGREKNLKEVLTNLHDEFQTLNLHYEGLFKKVNEVDGDADEETLKELEHLEHSLNKKEEEITMVMALYKEVIALKQQVKTLKDKASLASVAIAQQQQQQQQQQQHPQQQQQQFRFRDYNDPSAAIHLTKLLRQIQTYQEMYKIGRRN